MTRRGFALASVIATGRFMSRGSGNPKEAIDLSIAKHRIPAAVFLTANAKGVTYTSAHGQRDSRSGVKVQENSIFAIASMTKAITTTCVMQLVEQRKLQLRIPAGEYVPALREVPVIAGFDSAGKPQLRKAKRPVTLADLITHTSGFTYDIWDSTMAKYSAATPSDRMEKPVLAFDPGTRWQYGNGTHWAGRIAEAVSGKTLEQYMQENVLGPLGMVDTSYILKPERFDRLVSSYRRRPDGQLSENERKQPTPPRDYNGDGGLYSTAEDYAKFGQMILNDGRGANRARILKPTTVAMMKHSQTPHLQAGVLKTLQPDLSADVNFHEGAVDRYTFGFLLNETPHEGGRSAGSLAWAGLYNTYYWIDPKRSLVGVAMMQFLPFADPDAIAVLSTFEHAVYSSIAV